MNAYQYAEKLRNESARTGTPPAELMSKGFGRDDPALAPNVFRFAERVRTEVARTGLPLDEVMRRLKAGESFDAPAPPPPKPACFVLEIVDAEAFGRRDRVLLDLARLTAVDGVPRIVVGTPYPFTERTVVSDGERDVFALAPADAGQIAVHVSAAIDDLVLAAHGHEQKLEPRRDYLPEAEEWARVELAHVPTSPIATHRGEDLVRRRRVADRLRHSFLVPDADVERIAGVKPPARGLWPVGRDAERLDQQRQAEAKAAEALALEQQEQAHAVEVASKRTLAERGEWAIELRLGVSDPPSELGSARWCCIDRNRQRAILWLRAIPGMQLPPSDGGMYRILRGDEIPPAEWVETKRDAESGEIIRLGAAEVNSYVFEFLARLIRQSNPDVGAPVTTFDTSPLDAEDEALVQVYGRAVQGIAQGDVFRRQLVADILVRGRLRAPDVVAARLERFVLDSHPKNAGTLRRGSRADRPGARLLALGNSDENTKRGVWVEDVAKPPPPLIRGFIFSAMTEEEIQTACINAARGGLGVVAPGALRSKPNANSHVANSRIERKHKK